MAETTRNALLRELGAEVRDARERAGLGVRALAREARISTHSRISELERGNRLLSADELERILDKLGVTGTERDRLLGLARSATSPGELVIGQPGISQNLAQLIDHERSAVRITDVSPLLIPGLLQTTDYARAIMGPGADSETRVALRAGRRDILTRRRSPVQLIALIDSEALVRPIAPPDVMLDQLRHILHLAELPNVTVQIVSSTRPGYNPMLAGAFELIEFAKGSPIVHLEHHGSSSFRWEGEVQRFVEGAEEIRKKVAMTPDQSIGVIADIAQGMETT